MSSVLANFIKTWTRAPMKKDPFFVFLQDMYPGMTCTGSGYIIKMSD